MNNFSSTKKQETFLDDVRRIREQFSRESGGDIRLHAEQTRAAFAELQAKFGLRLVGEKEITSK